MENACDLIRSFVVDNFILDPEEEQFTDDTDLKASGVLDSLALLRLITFIDKQFAVELHADDFEQNGPCTVVNIGKLLHSRMKRSNDTVIQA